MVKQGGIVVCHREVDFPVFSVRLCSWLWFAVRRIFGLVSCRNPETGERLLYSASKCFVILKIRHKRCHVYVLNSRTNTDNGFLISKLN